MLRVLPLPGIIYVIFGWSELHTLRACITQVGNGNIENRYKFPATEQRGHTLIVNLCAFPIGIDHGQLTASGSAYRSITVITGRRDHSCIMFACAPYRAAYLGRRRKDLRATILQERTPCIPRMYAVPQQNDDNTNHVSNRAIGTDLTNFG